MDCRGAISKKDIEEILRQYVDALGSHVDLSTDNYQAQAQQNVVAGSRVVNLNDPRQPKSIRSNVAVPTSLAAGQSGMQHDHRTLSQWIRDVS